MRIAVLSDGGWGTALALLLCANGHDVSLWSPFPEYAEEMARERLNRRFLPGVPLPAGLVVSGDLAAVAESAGVLVLAAPTQYLGALLRSLAGVGRRRDVVFVNVAKGIEVGSLRRVSQMVASELGTVSYVVLSGPSHAEEVARGIPTAVVAASAQSGAAELVQDAFMNDVFRVYTSRDVVGVELGGALKNVFALAAGVLDGMGMGDNTKAALMTRGIVEMARLGQALGGAAETFSGLSGIGDLIVTCMSRHSRNRHVGEELGRGRELADVQAEMGMVVAEGVRTSESAYALARRFSVDTPIVNEVYAGLYGGKDPRTAVRDLMTRDAKPERG